MLRASGNDAMSKLFLAVIGENDKDTRVHRFEGRQFSEHLLEMLDKPWFRHHKELTASLFKFLVRRDQMRGVGIEVKTNKKLHSDAATIHHLHSTDLASLAAKASDSAMLKSILHDTTVAASVRTSLYHVQRIMSKVMGTDSERASFQKKFESLRFYHGHAALFWTLNPRDTNNPLTIHFTTDESWKSHKVSLDLDELALHGALQDARSKNSAALAELVIADPLAAAKCFHTTVQMTMELLFNSTPPVHKGAAPSDLHPDGFACQLNPGVAGFLSWYMGVVEPQLRKALHLHALLGVVGCRDLEKLLLGSDIATTFVSVWQYVASVCFRSPEAFAAHCQSDAALEQLSKEELIPLSEAQKESVAPQYAFECTKQQKLARGLDTASTSVPKGVKRPYEPIGPKWLADASLTPDQWSSQAVCHFNTSFRACGNHKCMPRVCLKGKHGKKGLCRFLFWHWCLKPSRKDAMKQVIKRIKGRKLVARWSWNASKPELPPVDTDPPQRGMPSLETNHGFTCRFTPAGSLGACTNHDMNPLLRLPVLPADLKERLAQALAAGSQVTCSDLTEAELSTFTTACEEVLANVVEHEYYCGSYSSKEQPKLKELLGAMASSLRKLEARIEMAKQAGETFDRLTIAAKFLHNLVSAANRCSHKGYPEIMSYLSSRPMFYCSHSFTNLFMNNVINEGKAIIARMLEPEASAKGIPDAPTAQYTTSWRPNKAKQLNDIDYMWRPKLLDVVPWYFFTAMCECNLDKPGALPWYSYQTPDGSWVHHPFFQFVKKHTFPRESLCR